jgi:hypothetical protein
LIAVLDKFNELEEKGLASLHLPPLTPAGPILSIAFDDQAGIGAGEMKRLASRQKRTSTAWLQSVSRSILSRESKPRGVAEKIKSDLQGNTRESLRYFSSADRREILNCAKRKEKEDRGKRSVGLGEEGTQDSFHSDSESNPMKLPRALTSVLISENLPSIAEQIVDPPRVDLFDDALADSTHSVLSYLSAKQRELDYQTSIAPEEEEEEQEEYTG